MNTNKHRYSVSTAQAVKGLKVKFEEWKNMLVGEDIHSIRNQIWDMIWYCAFFRCINESRKYAAKDDKGDIKQNWMVHRFINQSFFKTQLLSIRRLTDKRSDVYSLYRLIGDIKKNSSILTRKNILAFNNAPYDYEKAMECLWQNVPKIKKGNIQTQTLNGNTYEIEFSKDIHRQIDSMAGIAADKRSPDDLVLNDNGFKRFDDWLKNSQELRDYVNKYIAHSATLDSRKVIPDEIGGALGKVLNAHKIICETASFIGNNLLFCGFGDFLPISRYGQFDQFDIFEYLDEPIASKETVEKLRGFWEKYRAETEQWVQIVV
jgi:hypothetical protein